MTEEPRPTPKAYYLGSRDQVCQQLEEILSLPCRREVPRTGERQDILFVEAFAGPEVLGSLPGGNAFVACRDVKSRLGMRVFVLVQAGDRVGGEIARFCMADGSLEVGAAGLVMQREEIHERLAPRRHGVPVDSLLHKLERELASDQGRQASALQRMLEEGRKEHFLDKLVDPETGLFDGPFASFKLDEEFKRATRFHQPLSLLLLDIGGDAGLDLLAAAERRARMAEVASVFLNECRDIDVISRFTPTVFMVLMPETGAAGASVVARRMLDELQKRGIFAAGEGEPCAGLATVPAAGISDRQGFLARAEACLKLAREGRGEAGFCSSSE